MAFLTRTLALTCVLAIGGVLPSAIVSEESSPLALDDYDTCGITSLYCVARLAGAEVEYERVRELLGPGKDGLHSFAELVTAAEELGMSPLSVKVTRSQLQSLPLPAIVHMRSSYFRQDKSRPHFAVLLNISPDGAHILDPPFSTALFKSSEFDSLWTGNILVFADSQESADRLHVALGSQHTDGTINYLRSSGGVLSAVMLALAVLDMTATWFARKHSRHDPAAPSPALHDSPAKRPRRPLVGKVVLSGSLLFIAFVASTAVWQFAQPARPHLDVSEEVIDLGEFAPGDCDSEVVLRNPGTRALLISQVITSCACATPEIPSTIPPHGETRMRISLTTRSGNNNAEIVMLSNDPDGPKRLALRWRGSRTPQLSPPRVADARASLGKPWQRVVHLTYPGGQFAVLPKVLAIGCPLPNVQIEIGKNDPLAFRTARGLLSQKTTIGYLDLVIRIDPPKDAGVIESVCTVSVEYGKETYELALPIRVHFENCVQLRPQKLLLSASDPAKILGKERIVHIEMHNKCAVDTFEIVDKPDWLECRVGMDDCGQRHLAVAVKTLPEHIPCKETVILRNPAELSTKVSLDVPVMCWER